MDSGGYDRSEAIDTVATTLVSRSNRLLRLVASIGMQELTRTEAGLLGTLRDGPLRITELAESEAIAQPTASKLVDRLEERGLVVRSQSAQDGRVVFVDISTEGRAKLDRSREQIQRLISETVEDLTDEELGALVTTSVTLERMIRTLQARSANR
jgi:DNA-binding MarR family transcriptional regulator